MQALRVPVIARNGKMPELWGEPVAYFRSRV
jgi:hypothetical protein